jgi:hypothetical protein
MHPIHVYGAAMYEPLSGAFEGCPPDNAVGRVSPATTDRMIRPELGVPLGARLALRQVLPNPGLISFVHHRRSSDAGRHQ